MTLVPGVQETGLKKSSGPVGGYIIFLVRFSHFCHFKNMSSPPCLGTTLCVALFFLFTSLSRHTYAVYIPSGHDSLSIRSAGYIGVVAGSISGQAGSLDGSDTSALFDRPVGFCRDSSLNFYIADSNNHMIRKVTSGGVVSTLAGTGEGGHNDGAGATATFNTPKGVCLNGAENILYVADTENHVIRSIDLSTLIVSTIAGVIGTSGYLDGTVSTSLFHYPVDIVIGYSSGLVVVDQFNHRLRFIDSGLSTVSTIAGQSSRGSIDGILGTSSLHFPTGATFASDGLIYLTQNHCIRQVGLPGSSYLLTTLVGTNTNGLLDGIGTSARLFSPSGLFITSSMIGFVADQSNNVIRRVDLDSASSSYLEVVSLNAPHQPGSTVGDPSYSQMRAPSSVWIMSSDLTNETTLHILDSMNHRLLEMNAPCVPMCLNNAYCTTSHTCDCIDGYLDSLCSTPTCNPSCSTGFECSAKDTCTCPIGYTGGTCAEAVCSDPCQNGGSCISPDICSCTSQWTGGACEQPICIQTCINGNCTAPDFCTCDTGWSGSDCSTPICTLPCQNSGNCTAPDTCTCSEGWEGDICDEAICSPLCINGGNCTSPDVCECSTDWTGSYCQIAACSNPCLNGGLCVGPNECQCLTGWEGDQCETALCDFICQNGGNCTAPNTCTCPSTWNGTVCGDPVCNNPICGYNEICSAPDTCISSCSLAPCQNGGICIGTNQCDCVDGWIDIDCSVPVCDTPCLHGVCIAPSLCQCESGWGASNCTSPICTLPCLNGGICIEPDECQCIDNWLGDDCSIAICGGSEDGCIHGNCTSPDICICEPGYEGELCETPICTLPCINGGNCTAPDFCTCSLDFTDVDCSRVAKQGSTRDFSIIIITSSSLGGILFLLGLGWISRMKLDRKRLAEFKRQQEQQLAAVDAESEESESDSDELYG